MILHSYAKYVPLREISVQMGVNREGVTALAIVKTAEHYGLDAKGVTVGGSQLQELPKPAILHWGSNHFVVLTLWTGCAGQIVDPSHGRVQIGARELEKHFRGTALVFSPGEAFTAQERPPRSWRRYLHPIIVNYRTLGSIVLFSLGLRVLGLALPFLTATIIDRILPRREFSYVWLVAGGIVALVVGSGVGSIIRGYLLLKVRFRLDQHMMSNFFKHLLHLPFPFFEVRSTGDLLVRLSSNAVVRETLSQQILSVTLDLVFAATYLGLMLAYSVPLSILVFVFAGIDLALSYWSLNAIQPLFAPELQAHSKSQSYLVEAIRGMEIIKATASEPEIFARWSRLFKTQLETWLVRERKSVLIGGFTATASMAAPLALLLFGTVLVLRGQLTAGRMFGFNALAGSFLGPLATLFYSIQAFQFLRVHLDRLDDIFETPAEPTKASEPVELKGAIALDRVSFTHSRWTAMIVEDLTLEIQPGMMVAIIGETGSGKSTIAKLLSGLYTPTRGRVLYDGRSLQDIDLASTRRQLGIVPQGATLFNDTVRRNIAFHSQEADSRSIERAAGLAEIAGDIEAMPMAYETPLSEQGRNLSGGQRQRICIARALVHGPKILIFDEATSEIDTATELRIYKNLATLGCTQLVITHRFSAVEAFDLIVVVHRGRIIESGCHTALATSGGHYAQLLQHNRMLFGENAGSGTGASDLRVSL